MISSLPSLLLLATALQAASPASGPAMYRTYCASCHGIDGKGGGPAAKALNHPPADLTKLTHLNRGRFPATRVSQTIEGESGIAAHGSREMPVWGAVFRRLSPGDEARVKLRIRNLTRHIESLQR